MTQEISNAVNDLDKTVHNVFKDPTVFYKIKRTIKFWWQRRTRGWDDSETWDLDDVIAKFILPRLERFKELNNGYPYGFTEVTWDETLDKMILAFHIILDKNKLDITQEDVAMKEEGLNLFSSCFSDLWW